MEKIKKVVSAPLFQSALAGGIGYININAGKCIIFRNSFWNWYW